MLVTTPWRLKRQFEENPRFRLANTLIPFAKARVGDVVALAFPFHHQERPWQVDFLRQNEDGEIDQVGLSDLTPETAARVAPAALSLLTSAEIWTLLGEAAEITGRDQSEHLAIICAEAMVIVPFDEADYEEWSSNPDHATGDLYPEWINMLHVFEPPSNHAALEALPQIEALLEWHNRRIAEHLDPEHAVRFEFDATAFLTKEPTP